uniref:Uncharacterized protein n=1 Tax=Podoviridae sp. ctG4L18 TaxID=2825234 RepID=A0A8S5UPA5_9CAUD|nr:MAG TPA: hypothetical protein [Podoviridae sp. ctG4L18]
MSVLSIIYGIFMNTNKQLLDCPARSPYYLSLGYYA